MKPECSGGLQSCFFTLVLLTSTLSMLLAADHSPPASVLWSEPFPRSHPDGEPHKSVSAEAAFRSAARTKKRPNRGLKRTQR